MFTNTTIIDLILGGIAVLSLVIIARLIASKWKKLLLIDIDAMPDAKLRLQKYKIIEHRLQRKTHGAKSTLKKVAIPFARAARSTYGKIVELERKYRHALPGPQTQEEKERTRQKIASLMEAGIQLYKEGNFGEAEHTFLDIIRLNPQEVEAYEYLGEVYLLKKEHDHAIETLEFAKKLSPKDERIFYDLGVVYQQQGNQRKAMLYFEECVTLAPNNPKNLDALLQLAIEMKEKIVARQTLRKLKEANPENQKLPELEKIVLNL